MGPDGSEAAGAGWVQSPRAVSSVRSTRGGEKAAPVHGSGEAEMWPWAEPQQIWRVPWSLHPPRFLLCLQMLCASWPWARNPLHRPGGSCAEGQPGQGSGVIGSPTGWGRKKSLWERYLPGAWLC